MQVAGTHRWATDIANLMVISQWHGSTAFGASWCLKEDILDAFIQRVTDFAPVY